tara:strand:- start:86 stop:592 length:507 start_codon:yes stop_codon:yes gene_type:complete
MLLAKDAILAAARDLLIHAIQDEIEDVDANASLPGDDDNQHTVDSLADGIIENHADDVLLTMGLMIGAIGQAWGSEVGLVFYHMDLRDADDQAEPLYRLIMSCIGHGIAIDDDGPSGPMATAFDNAGRILCNVVGDKGKRFDHSPVNFDQHQHFTNPLITDHLIYPDE